MRDDELREVVGLVHQIPAEPDPDFVERLRREIWIVSSEPSGVPTETHRGNATAQREGIAEQETGVTFERALNGSQHPTRGSGLDWLVPVTEGRPMAARKVPWRTLVGLAAATLLIAAVGSLIARANDSNQSDDSAVSVLDEPTGRELLEPLTALEVVEGRYEAMNELDLEAIHANVSDDVIYCRLALEVVQQFEGCLDSSVDYHGPNGHGERIEIMALRDHAYGGAIEYRCDGDDTVVTCDQREVHLLLDAADTEYEFISFTYEVNDGKIVYIEAERPGPDGFVDTQVRTQEFAYVDWLQATHPEDFDELTAVGQPVPTRANASRHRELVAEWFASLDN